MKHLAGAAGYLEEIVSGHGANNELDHRMDLHKDLVHAERHLHFLDEPLARSVRNIRKRYEQNNYEPSPEIRNLIGIAWRTIQQKSTAPAVRPPSVKSVQSVPSVAATAQKKPCKPCGHRPAATPGSAGRLTGFTPPVPPAATRLPNLDIGHSVLDIGYSAAPSPVPPAVPSPSVKSVVSVPSVFDLVIPLADNSAAAPELRYALRSAAKNLRGLGRIFIVSKNLPAWLDPQQVTHVPCTDRAGWKDFNLIKKLLAACAAGVSEQFIFWSDDQFLMQPLDAASLMPMHEGDAGSWTNEQWTAKFNSKPPTCWWNRLQNTVKLLQAKGKTAWNFDSHHPTLYNRDQFKQLMQELDVLNESKHPAHGYTINTLYCNLAGYTPATPRGLIRCANCLPKPDTTFWNANEPKAWTEAEKYLKETFPAAAPWEIPAVPSPSVKSVMSVPSVSVPFPRKAFAFAFNEPYIQYAAVLAHSIIETNPDYDICCLTTNIAPDKLCQYPFNHPRVKLLPETVDIADKDKIILQEPDRAITGEACYMNTVRFRRVIELFDNYDLIFMSDADAVVKKNLAVTEKYMDKHDIGFIHHPELPDTHKIRAFLTVFNIKSSRKQCEQFLHSWNTFESHTPPSWFNDQLALLHAFKQHPEFKYFPMSKQHYCNFGLDPVAYIIGTSTGSKMNKSGYKSEFERISRDIDNWKNKSIIPLTALTYTGDRPVQFGICLKIMERMNPRPSQWLIVDDGKTPIAPELIPKWAQYIRREPQPGDPPMTLAKNILAGFEHLKYNTVAFIEDDDWYPLNYLAEQFKEAQGVEACGNNRRQLFQLNKNHYHDYIGSFPITASLLLNSENAIRQFHKICIDNSHGNGLDHSFWRFFTGKKKIHNNKIANSVGIKDWNMGRGPGYAPSHQSLNGCIPDPQRLKMNEWIGSEFIWYNLENLLIDPKVKKLDFIEIYNKNLWKSPESKSGKGSEMKHTEHLRGALPGMFKRLNIRSMLDIPCGDMNWMRTVDLSGIKYTGADIVPELIKQHQAAPPLAGATFAVMNLISDTLPACDLVFCRDCLVHLDFSDGLKAIANVKRSGIKYFASTSSTGLTENKQLTTGWRPVNLAIAPYNLGEPVEIINEHYLGDNGRFKDKSICVWKIN